MFVVEDIRKDFPILKANPNLVYFDNGATTFKPQCVIDAVSEFYSSFTSNVHRGDYDMAVKADRMFDAARQSVAHFINAKPEEIVFTAGASASLNQIAYGLKDRLHEGDVILTTVSEHASNILPWFKVAEQTGAVIEYIRLDEEGQISMEAFNEAMHDRVKVVTLAHVGNVMGQIQPVREMAAVAHAMGALMVVDGAQSVPHIPVDVKDMDCDFLAFSSHKMCGPSGVGVMYGKYELLEAMEPWLQGGGANARFDICGNVLLKHAPAKFEAGTPNIEGVIGLKAAVEYLEKIGMANIQAYEHELREYLRVKMQELDNVTIYNPHAPTGIVAFNGNGVFAQDTGSYLNTKNVAVRSGTHCAKILPELIGTADTVRASLYFYNTKEEIDRFVEACRGISVENCIGIFF
mgnify:FL=1